MTHRTIALGQNLFCCLLIAGFLLFLAPMSQGQNETILYNFTNGGTTGSYPVGRLVMDEGGNLYGVTQNGGANGVGTVFEVTPSGTEIVLHSFADSSTDGWYTTGGLVRDSGGNLYGLTRLGPFVQNEGCGAVFKVTPSGIESLLYVFTANNPYDGCGPQAGLISDSEGNLYGTTMDGGTFGCGTVFEVVPSSLSETVLYNFGSSATDGCYPRGNLVFDSQDNLYGTTAAGGTTGYGTVFKVVPSSRSETVLHSFGGPSDTKDGTSPQNSDLAIDKAGNLYGTTSTGGVFAAGTVFKVTPAGKETLLHSFGEGLMETGGSSPYYGVVRDAEGNLYGSTLFSAIDFSQTNAVFELTSSGQETVLHDFLYPIQTDGSEPSGNLIADAKGNLYGVTAGGGTTDGGTVYEIYRAGSTATTTTLTTSGSPAHYCDVITITATVSSAGVPVPDGELVTFDNGGSFLVTGTLSGGVATYSNHVFNQNGAELFYPLPIGSHVITALYTGDATYKGSQGKITQVVAKYSTITALSTSLSPSNYGQPVTLTAQVTNGCNPAGTVTFYNGSVKLGSAKLNSSVATLKTAALSLGTDTLTATYSGDTYHLASTSSPVTQIVNQAPITMSLTSSPNPSTSGKFVKFTATLASTGGLPTGVVTFSYDGTTLGTGTIAGGKAVFSTTALPVGTDNVQATYAGSSDYSSASGAITQTVN